MRMGKPVKVPVLEEAGQKEESRSMLLRRCCWTDVSRLEFPPSFFRKLGEMATESLEFYAGELLLQQDYLAAGAAEAQLGSDGGMRVDLSMPIPQSALCSIQFQIQGSRTMTELIQLLFEKGGGWKVHAPTLPSLNVCWTKSTILSSIY
jgi:hypothetical protein